MLRVFINEPPVTRDMGESNHARDDTRPGMIVRITKDCRSRVRKMLGGGDLSGKIGIISRVELMAVGDRKEAEVLSLDYPFIMVKVGSRDIGGMDCWWEATGKSVEHGDDVVAMLKKMTKKGLIDGKT